MAVYLLFLVRDIHLTATMIGVIFTLSGIVGFVGAVAAGRLSNHLGAGRLVVIGQAAIVTGGVLLAAVTGSRIHASVTMLIGEAFFGIGMSFWGVGSATLNQTRTPDDARGRIIGASTVLTSVMAAIAGLVGGGIASLLGLRASLVAGSVGMLLALVLILRRDVWRSGARETGNQP
jgi:MFS family permease